MAAARKQRLARITSPASRRRHRLTATILAIAAIGALGYAWKGRQPASATLSLTAARDQNVLLVTIDTLRADALGCCGGRARTPHLDRLALEGVRYDFAHAHTVVTLPSHTSILTGLYPFQHGVRDNSGYRVAARTPTLATLLEPHGFRTAAFIGAFPLGARFGLNRGFDVYDEQFATRGGSSDFAIPERPAEAVIAPAMAWLDAQTSRWFLWVHLYDPHAPYRPPAPFDREYADNPYAGEVAYTDHALGPLLDRVRTASARPTLVIVTADHGEALGDHGERTHGLFAYEATLRVPLIVARLGGGQPQVGGGVSQTPARHIDLVPTVLAALGIRAPEGLPGSPLMSHGRGDDDAAATGDSYFEALSPSLNRGWAPLRGVLSGRHKYVDLPIEELYDLSADPGERNNAAGRDRDRVRVLAARLAAFGADTGMTGRVREDADAAARLRALGYISGTAEPKARYTERDDPKRLVEIDAQIARGIESYELGRPAEAAAIYRQILDQRPDMPLAYLHLAFLQWDLGQVAQAIETLEIAIRRGVHSLEIQARLGTYLAESGDARRAVALLEGAVPTDTSDLDALTALGIAYARGGQPARALSTFERILALDAANTMAQENIGAVRLQQRDLDGAQRAFDAALARNPRSARAEAGLAVIALRRGDRDGAIAGWKRAIALDPRDYDSLFNLGQELARAGRLAEATPYLTLFVDTAPPDLYAADIARIRAALDRR